MKNTEKKKFTYYFRVLGKNVGKKISQMFSVADYLCFGIIMYQLDEL